MVSDTLRNTCLSGKHYLGVFVFVASLLVSNANDILTPKPRKVEVSLHTPGSFICQKQIGRNSISAG